MIIIGTLERSEYIRISLTIVTDTIQQQALELLLIDVMNSQSDLSCSIFAAIRQNEQDVIFRTTDAIDQCQQPA